MHTTIKTAALPFSSAKTYLAAAAFVVGNIILPQLFHLVPQGGVTWLPIYFFTLVGACVFGWRVGLITAIASPAVNSLLFGMPAAAVLPAILIKSVLLAVLAGVVAERTRLSIPVLAAVVLGYQALGTLGEWALCGNFALACQDFRIGLPGMLMQVFAGYAVIRYWTNKSN